MSHNPYAAPAGAPYSMPVAAPGPPQPWAVGEVFASAWDRYREQWPTLTFATLGAQLLGALPGEVAPGLVVAGVIEPSSREYFALHVPMTLAGIALQTFFHVGLVRLYLATLRGEGADFATVFGGADRTLALIAARLLSSVAVLVGLALFVVPGVLVALSLMMAPYYVVDRRLGPIEAMRASRSATEGQRGELFALSLAMGGIMLVGIVACCVGVVVAEPVVALAQALVYARISGTIVPAHGAEWGWGQGGGYPVGPSR